tara:strand:+ start:1319 stop:1423 length:105 start_codon:yes stop_codon:yes gene_type:complete
MKYKVKETNLIKLKKYIDESLKEELNKKNKKIKI